VKMAVREWLWIQGPYFCHDGIFKLMPRQESCIRVLGDFAACSSSKLVSVLPISWHYAGDLSWYKIMIYKLMCLLKTMCFHLGMTSDYIWDYGTPHERVATEERFDRKTDIHYEFERMEEKFSIHIRYDVA